MHLAKYSIVYNNTRVSGVVPQLYVESDFAKIVADDIKFIDHEPINFFYCGILEVKEETANFHPFSYNYNRANKYKEVDVEPNGTYLFDAEKGILLYDLVSNTCLVKSSYYYPYKQVHGNVSFIFTDRGAIFRVSPGVRDMPMFLRNMSRLKFGPNLNNLINYYAYDLRYSDKLKPELEKNPWNIYVDFKEEYLSAEFKELIFNFMEKKNTTPATLEELAACEELDPEYIKTYTAIPNNLYNKGVDAIFVCNGGIICYTYKRVSIQVEKEIINFFKLKSKDVRVTYSVEGGWN